MLIIFVFYFYSDCKVTQNFSIMEILIQKCAQIFLICAHFSIFISYLHQLFIIDVMVNLWDFIQLSNFHE